MICVAICDDDDLMVRELHSIVNRNLTAQGIGCEISEYTESKNLLYDIAEDQFFFDIMLLDIEMPGITGMELARQITPCLPDVKIIFITSHIEYAIDAFELSVFRYVPKNDLETRLPAAIRDAARLIELEDGKTYTISDSRRLEKIPFREILFIQRDGKNAKIVTTRGISKVRKSLQQVYGELAAEEFLFIDRGCIVNLIHIKSIRESTAFLKSGEGLPISRSHLSDVKEKINRYWGAHI